MLTAVIAGIIAALIVVGIVVVVVVMRSHNQGEYEQNPNNEISQLDTVGVGAAEERPEGEVRVNRSDSGAKRPSDTLGKRFAAIGVLAGAIFATLGAKLWSMQVMSSDEYSSESEKNLYTTVKTPAPRGGIFDRNGIVIVTNKASQTVLTDSDVADNNDVMRRLSAVLGLPIGIIKQRILDTASGAQSQRIVASDARLRDVAFISEHADAFPGVTVESRTVRQYPFGALASHVVGYTGAPTEDELKADHAGRTIESTDTLGKSGIEAYYDNLLAGDQGTRKVMVDASGNVVAITAETAPVKGSDIYLTIDARVQYAADMALKNTIAPEGDIGTGMGVAGSIVAMDVRDGSIIAMASYPTFDPSNFTNGIPQEIWDLYNTKESHSPMMNRSINGLYAAASTMKAFSAMAALNYGFANEGTTWGCSGEWDGFGSGDIQKCWLERGHGTLDLNGGIVHSCDTVFYEIAAEFFRHGPEGTGELSETALQEYLQNYKFGSVTGVDLQNESAGRVPTPEWKAEHWRNVPSEARWVGGDYTNMIIGQGDILVTPLQVAAGYSAIASGKMMRPHLLKEVHNAEDEVVLEFEPEVVAEPDVHKGHLEYVRNALRNMVTANFDVNSRFMVNGIEAAGKSGTAEHTDRMDDSWFVAYAPYDNPRYVVACIVEEGDSGTGTAAPIVADIMGEVFKAEAGEIDGGIGRVPGSTGVSIEREVTVSAGRTD